MARRGAGRLSAAELDEMVALYQRTSANLAHARTTFDDVGLVARLSRILGLARGTIYRRRTRPGVAIGRFFAVTFPAAVWATRRAMVVSACLFLLPALAVGLWLGNNDTVRRAAIPEELQRSVATHDFESYYSSDAAEVFQTHVTVNNIVVSFAAFATGVLLGVPTAVLLATNGANVGVMAAVMHSHDRGALFWGLILPHGLLEISSIIVAGAAGLMLAWAIISPGERTRAAALAEEGLRTASIVIGLTLCFAVAALIEAQVTPSGLPTWARIGIGVAVEAVFILYVLSFGRAAAAAGHAGHLREQTG